MRPARVAVVLEGPITITRSKPLGWTRKSLTAQEWLLLPMVDATTAPPPNQWRARASVSSCVDKSPCTMASSMAAIVRPGMLASQSGGTISSDNKSGRLAPR